MISWRRRRTLWFIGAVLVVLALAWFWRVRILAGAAGILVNEDPLAPAEIMVVSNSMPAAAAIEAASLYNRRVSAHIVMADLVYNAPLAQKIRQLGIPYLGAADLKRAILERSGVPSSAVIVLPDRVDGTESEVAAIVAFAERRHAVSLLVITARSHTARTKWLLQHKLPSDTRVSVRSPPFDRFRVDAWWRERDQSREVVAEYLRWINTLFGDLWRRPVSGQPRFAGGLHGL